MNASGHHSDFLGVRFVNEQRDHLLIVIEYC